MGRDVLGLPVLSYMDLITIDVFFFPSRLIEPHRGYERCDKYEAEGTTLGGDVSTWDVILVIESLPGSRLSGAAVGCRLTGGASPSAKQVRHVVHADGRWSG